jgi:hypothetical protein
MEQCPDPSEDILTKINFIHEVKIYNEIQNHKKIIIFDLRSRETFAKSHIQFALNLPYKEYEPSFYINFDEEKLCLLTTREELKSMIRRFKRYYIVIIMSEHKIKRKHVLNYHKQCPVKDQEERDIIKKSVLLYQTLTSGHKVREIGLYNLGFERFTNHYYFIINRGIHAPISKYSIY